ncbi:amidohydrolase family protein [bacterium]|nr:amidohydrolase family protein [bacterium]
MIYLHAHTLVTMTGEIISPGTLVIHQNKIEKVAAGHLSPSSADSLIDLSNTVLFPGFINAHCHLEYTAMGPLQNRSFTAWIKEIVSAKQKADDSKINAGINKGIKTLLQNGVTTVGDHISFNTPLEAILKSPLRGILFAEALGVADDVGQGIYHSLQNLKTSLPPSQFQFSITPHSVHALNPNVLKEILMKEPGPFSIHLAESDDEHQFFSLKQGPLHNFIKERAPHFKYESHSGLKHIINSNLPVNKLTLIHGNYLDDVEQNFVLKNKIPVVHCPGSHRFFNHQDFPLEKYLKHNHPVALGTDSHASNDHFSFLEELKLVHKSHPSLSAKQIITMATVNGAKALRMENIIGSLENEKSADIVGFKMQNIEDPFQLPFLLNKCDFLMINGIKI